MRQIPFTKMVAAGNDFIIVDARSRRFPRLPWRDVSRGWCARARGIGADGLLVLEPSPVADVRMRVFNPDGSEAEMCGNGARCVALYLKETDSGMKQAEETIQAIETKAGVLSTSARGERVTMRMTDPTALQPDVELNVNGRRIRAGFINTGVPHLVVPVHRLETVEVERLGRALRSHRRFTPRGTNVNFMQADPRRANRLLVRTYERGVEAETLACGTGVVASAVMMALFRNRASGIPPTAAGNGSRQGWKLDVQPRSGDWLTVSFDLTFPGRTQRVSKVLLEGAARIVFRGTANWPRSRKGV